MTITHGWVDWASPVAGMRMDKRYPDTNRAEGIVWHSQEGYGLTAMMNIHQRDDPPSFMFWLAKDGVLHQFSPVTHSVWCSGSYDANVRYWPVEMEGLAGEPINDAQMRTALRLIGEWEAHTGRQAARPGTMADTTMWEHREVATRWLPNAGITSCPSGRYDRLWVLLNGGDEPMTPAERAKMDALEKRVTALEDMDKRFNEVLQARYELMRAANAVDADKVVADAKKVQA